MVHMVSIRAIFADQYGRLLQVRALDTNPGRHRFASFFLAVAAIGGNAAYSDLQ